MGKVENILHPKESRYPAVSKMVRIIFLAVVNAEMSCDV
jgi:hypothetical protein